MEVTGLKRVRSWVTMDEWPKRHRGPEEIEDELGMSDRLFPQWMRFLVKVLHQQRFQSHSLSGLLYQLLSDDAIFHKPRYLSAQQAHLLHKALRTLSDSTHFSLEWVIFSRVYDIWNIDVASLPPSFVSAFSAFVEKEKIFVTPPSFHTWAALLSQRWSALSPFFLSEQITPPSSSPASLLLHPFANIHLSP